MFRLRRDIRFAASKHVGGASFSPVRDATWRTFMRFNTGQTKLHRALGGGGAADDSKSREADFLKFLYFLVR